MKKVVIFFMLAHSISLVVGQEKSDPTYQHYKDIKIGAPLALRYDPVRKNTYSAVTGETIPFFINTSSGDTVYGKGFYIVNHFITHYNGAYGLDSNKVKWNATTIWSRKTNKKLQKDQGWKYFNPATASFTQNSH